MSAACASGRHEYFSGLCICCNQPEPDSEPDLRGGARLVTSDPSPLPSPLAAGGTEHQTH